MRGKMVLVSAVVTLVAFSGVHFATTSMEEAREQEERRLSEIEREAELRFESVERVDPGPRSPSWPESFEAVTFPPEGWRVVNNDGGLHTWVRSSLFAHTGAWSADCRWESSILRNDDWLITPWLALRAGVLDTLSFWQRVQLAAFPESLEVRLSTTGTALADFTVVLWAGTVSNTAWIRRVVTLDAWDGNNVYIAFVYRGLNQFRVFVDMVSGPPFYVPTHDVGVTSIIAPVGSYLANTTVAPKAIIRNFATMAQTFPTHFRIYDAAGIEVYSEVITTNLLPGVIDTLVFPDFLITEGSFSALSYTALVGDEKPANDSASSIFMGVDWKENFETTDGGFSANMGWEWGVPAFAGGPAVAYSGVRLWGTRLTGNYSNLADYRLERDFLALSDNPVLLFYHWNWIEGTPAVAWDGGNLKISTDGGATWSIIVPVGGYPADSIRAPALLGQPGYTGDVRVWRLARFELPGVMAGDIFRIRWHFGSDAVIVFAGWYIDDVAGLGLMAFPQITSIQDVQYTVVPGVDSTYPSPLLGKHVRITGVVTGVMDNGNFWLQESVGGPWSGIFISDTIIGPARGDSITLIGEVYEMNGMTVLRNILIPIIHSSTHTLPPVSLVTTGMMAAPVSGEPYEGCLVRVENVVVTQTVDAFGQWYVDDGTGECQIDDLMHSLSPEFGQGGSIIGCVDYAAGEYAINPRDHRDIALFKDYDMVVIGLPNQWDPDTLNIGVFDAYAIVQNYSTPTGPTVSFVVHYKMSDEDGNRIASKSANVRNLAPHAMDTVYFQGGIPLMFPGTYTAVVTIRTGFADPEMVNNVSIRQFEVVGAKMGTEQVPEVFALHRTQPNPVRGDVVIGYQLPRNVDVLLAIYDVSGRLVTSLVDGQESAGYYNVRWDPPSAGIYFVKLIAGDFTATQRILVLR